MLVEWIVEWSLGFLSTLLGLLPEDGVSWPDGNGLGSWLGEAMGPMDSVMPVAEMVDVTLLTVNVVFPAMVVFRLTMFIYGKIPVVGS